LLVTELGPGSLFLNVTIETLPVSFPGNTLRYPLLANLRFPFELPRTFPLAVLAFPSRPELASAGGCATGLRTRSRHAYDDCSASQPFGSGSATADGGALARGHGSDLLSLRLPFAHRPAVPFLASPAFRELSGVAHAASAPRLGRPLCLAFRRLSFGGCRFLTAGVARAVLAHSSNRLPSG
jgi:hypothetical protein